MGELKPGWRRVKFGEVVRLGKQRCADPVSEGIERYIGLEHIEPGDLRVRSWGDVTDGTTFTTRVRPGHVLFGKRRAYQRKVAVADFDAVCSGDIYVFESADPRKLLPELLPFLCQTDAFFVHAVGTSAGSLSPRTNWTSLAGYEFALPPIEEQRRQAALFCGLEAVRAAAANAAERFRAVRVRFYLDATLIGIRGGPVRSSPIGEVANHWQVAPLATAAVIENHLRKPINSTERAAAVGPYPYYGPTGILDYINEFRFEGRYVLIGEDGDHFLKWPSWSMTQLATGRFSVNNHAHAIRGTQACLTDWLFHFYRHRSVDEWVTKQGAGRLKLKKSTLERMLIALPPVDEQADLVAFFESLDEHLEALDERCRVARQMLNGALSTLSGISNVH